MKSKIFLLIFALTARLCGQTFPNGLDPMTNPGDWLRPPQAQEAMGTYNGSPVGTANPTVPQWLSNAATSIRNTQSYALSIAAPRQSSGSLASTSKLGTLFLLGDSYLDDVGNDTYLQSGVANMYAHSDGPSYGMALGNILGQPLCSVGRYTPAGASPLAQNYSVASSTITGNLVISFGGLAAEVTKLLSDYPSGLPNGCVVLINIGINDILNVAQNAGGQWTGAVNSTWTTSSSTQTLPSAGSTMILNVVSSTGATAGATNYIDIPVTISGTVYHSADLNNLIPITAVGTGTISFVVPSTPGFAGSTIAPSSVIQTMAQRQINAELTGSWLSTLTTAVQTAGGQIILSSPPDVSLLPGTVADGITTTLAHNTWLMYCNQLNTNAVALTNQYVRLWDLQPLFSSVLAASNANASIYGFKATTTPWNQTAGESAHDFFLWDGFHPTGAGHRVIGRKLLEMFNYWGFVY